MQITSKGQVTIPQNIRERLGLLPHTEVRFELAGDHAKIRKAGRAPGASGRGRLALEALGTESFNTVLFMGNTFGLLSAPQKGQRLLATLAKITAADARLIAVCQAAPSSLTDPSTPQYRQRNRQLGLRLGNVRLRCRYKTFIGGWCDFLLARPREACKVLEKSVWKVSRVVLETEPHYVIVAEKR